MTSNLTYSPRRDALELVVPVVVRGGTQGLIYLFYFVLALLSAG